MSIKMETDGYVMIDKHGRRMRKLRISLLDACNLRCLYCMPENPKFMKQEDWASAEDLIRIAQNLVGMGIEEIRLTGGEPTLRKDLVEIAEGLSGIGVEKLGLTTNALLLKPLLPMLKDTELRHLNISLDTLDAENFKRITRRSGHEHVMDAIYTAKDLGFEIKVNVVAMRGLNDHEVVDFALWSAKHDIPVRLLESMKIGVMKNWYEARFIPADEMIENLQAQYTLTPMIDAVDSTSRNYHVSNGAWIGFITSESKPFCGGCSRLRLTPQGHIRPCLFMEQGIDLKPLRKEEYPEALQDVIDMKPFDRIPYQQEEMYKIGG